MRVKFARVTLLDELRGLTGDEQASSFQLMGEDLVLISGDRLQRAGLDWQAELERRLPAAERTATLKEQARVLGEARELLVSFNKSVHTRIRGYLALGRRVRFEYPWPVVAILGICEVLRSIRRVHLFGLLGASVSRFGFRQLEELAERSDDVLRRTNRGIFADSAPTVLYALHCHELRAAGRAELARRLLDAPLPMAMDGETRAIASALYDGLAIDGDEARFAALSELTLRHFSREQSIFTHHLGGTVRRSGPRSFVQRLFEAKSVPAPRIVNGKLVFRPYELSEGFSMRDHDARVREFSDAFVRSITRSISEYRVAVAYVIRRFGEPHERVDLGYKRTPS